MNHVALAVDPHHIELYQDRLRAKGVPCTEVMNHDDSPTQMAAENHPGVWLRSVYFWDPDGALLEFAAWTRPLTAADVAHAPVNAKGERTTEAATTVLA
jgi:hypothetical protein